MGLIQYEEDAWLVMRQAPEPAAIIRYVSITVKGQRVMAYRTVSWSLNRDERAFVGAGYFRTLEEAEAAVPTRPIYKTGREDRSFAKYPDFSHAAKPAGIPSRVTTGTVRN